MSQRPAVTIDTLQQLNDLHNAVPPAPDQARAQAQAIARAELAAWLQARVTNPAAEQYLIDLFYGENGVTSGGKGAYHRFYRELGLRLRPRLRRTVLGWGEISQVAEISGSFSTAWRHPRSGDQMPVVYKKMPPFLDRTSAEAFVKHYLEYNTVLRDEVGIPVPHFEARITEPGSNQVFIFVIQERVDPASVCHEILRDIGPQAAERLYRLILAEYAKLYHYNQTRDADGYRVGLDGQIPNWSVAGYDGDPDAITGREKLIYLDTNVPMIRIHGEDVVSTDMYFQSLPGAARWLIKKLNLDQEVMDRYFQIRIIMLDFLGNTIVRHREDLVPRFIELSNEALAGPFAGGNFKPFTREEVEAYYRSDVSTWRLWRSLKLLGVLSDGVSSGQWSVLKRGGEFYRIWTEPIFE